MVSINRYFFYMFQKSVVLSCDNDLDAVAFASGTLFIKVKNLAHTGRQIHFILELKSVLAEILLK